MNRKEETTGLKKLNVGNIYKSWEAGGGTSGGEPIELTFVGNEEEGTATKTVIIVTKETNCIIWLLMK